VLSTASGSRGKMNECYFIPRELIRPGFSMDSRQDIEEDLQAQSLSSKNGVNDSEGI